MRNCSIEKQDRGFWLSFQIHGDGSELFEYGIPIPNHYERSNNASYKVYWLVDGYIHTKKGRDYLNDIVARFSGAFRIRKRLGRPCLTASGVQSLTASGVQSLTASGVQSLTASGHLFDDLTASGFSLTASGFSLTASERTSKLLEFGGLPSLRSNRSVKELHSSKYEDNVFWAIKLEAIMRIRINGWLDRSSLEDWASDVFLVGEHVKDRSTLRAKCRSVYEWYESRNWRVDERVSTMSRIEGMAKARAIKSERVKAKIQGAINVLKLYGSKITVRAVAEEAGIGTATAQKYLKELKASGGLGETPREEQSDGSSSAGRSEASTLNAKKNDYAYSRSYLEVSKKGKGAAAFLLK